jgi:transketolase
VGLALAAKLDKRSSRVFCLLGDGELAEGSNWEAAMTAAHYHLDNLTAVIDRNGLQITGKTEEVNELEPLDEKWSAFGWSVRKTDGNNVGDLIAALDSLPFAPGKPGVLIASTIKGKGVSFIESQVGWHHHVPTEEEYERALRELEAGA